MHNTAQRVLEDLLLFTWPLGYIAARIILFDSRENRFKRLEFMVGGLGLFTLFLFLLVDGELILDLTRAHPVWGADLLIAVACIVLAVALNWQQTQSDNDQLSRGVLDGQIVDVKLVGLRPRIFAGTAAALTILAVCWLYLISKTATG